MIHEVVRTIQAMGATGTSFWSLLILPAAVLVGYVVYRIGGKNEV